MLRALAALAAGALGFCTGFMQHVHSTAVSIGSRAFRVAVFPVVVTNSLCSKSLSAAHGVTARVLVSLRNTLSFRLGGSKKAPAAFNNQPSPTAAMVPGNWMFAAAVVQPAHTYQSPGNNEAMSPPSANGSIARSPEERRLRTPEDKRLEGLSPMQREIMRRTKQIGIGVVRPSKPSPSRSPMQI